MNGSGGWLTAHCAQELEGANSASRRGLASLLALVFVWISVSPSAAAENPPGRILGQVIHAIQGLPVPGATVEISARRCDRTAGGDWVLRSLADSLPVSTLLTDANGRFDCPISVLADGGWFCVGVRAEGFLEQIHTLVHLEVEQRTELRFELVPDRLTFAEAEVFNLKQFQSAVHQFCPDPLAGSAAEPVAVGRSQNPNLLPEASSTSGEVTSQYSAPEQVYVTNLAGVGFTGFMPLEELVAGTVTAEMNDGFPFEALKAQAIAARTFALDRWRRRGYANGGQAYSSVIGSKSLTATVNTASLVLLYSGLPITAYFSARCNGDFTLNSEEGPTLSDCRVGGLGAGAVPYARSRPCSGHANCSSTSEPCCSVVVRGKIHYLYGHGVGLCQRGAQELAGRDGWGWEQILTNYYTGIAVANRPESSLGRRVIASANVNVRPEPCASSVIDRLVPGDAGRIVGGPQRPVCSLASPYDHLTWWRIQFDNGITGWAAEDFLRFAAEDALALRWWWSGHQLVLSWSTSAPPATLQTAASSQAPMQWLDTADPVTVVNGFNTINIRPEDGHRFYRLKSR